MDTPEFREVRAEQEQKEQVSTKQPVKMAQPQVVVVNI
jgi:hypothetical protein